MSAYCRLHVQLLADVLADLDQVGAALAAMARCGLMAVFDARQFRRQRLAAGARALALGRRLAFEFFLDGGQVHVDRFLEQLALLADERFTCFAEAYPAVVGQFVRQRRDFEVLLGEQRIASRQGRIASGELGLLPINQGTHLRQQCWVDAGAGKVVERVHALQFTGPAPCLQA
jgi:hypothetical protein